MSDAEVRETRALLLALAKRLDNVAWRLLDRGDAGAADAVFASVVVVKAAAGEPQP